MAEKESQIPPPPPPSLPVTDHPQAMAFTSHFERGDWRKYMAVKVSTEYDSEESVFINKVSARVLNGLAKIKASFQRDQEGELRAPMLGLASKYLSILYDHEERNALVTGSADLGSRCRIKYLRDIRARQGEVKLIAQSTDGAYQAEIGYDLPALGLPRASLVFPNGEVKIEEEQREEFKVLSINGFVGARVLNGLLVSDYRDENLSLKYKFKDAEMTIAPMISVPSRSISLAFKRQFDPVNKLSYLYNLDSASWSAVYKHKRGESLKIKAGYDSDVRIAWASAWLGKEESGAKKAPRKCKLQVMLQVPQDNVKSSVLLFKVKKRWDL